MAAAVTEPLLAKVAFVCRSLATIQIQTFSPSHVKLVGAALSWRIRDEACS